MVVGYRMSGLMPAFLSLMEVARPFVIGPLLTDRFQAAPSRPARSWLSVC